jgi:hypothetical protein
MDNKRIQVDLSQKVNLPKKTKPLEHPKERQKRIVTTTKKWSVPDINTQYQIIENLQKTIHNNINEPESGTSRDPLQKLILQQMNQKIGGYKAQDIEKDIFSETEFVDLPKVLDIMIDCQNHCFYCKTRVHVLYEYVREPNQWTLERIDNKFGHNKTNTVIACLKCNLSRRTMYHERYVFTKQLNIIKQS